MTASNPRPAAGPPLGSLVNRLTGPRSSAWDITERAYVMDRNGESIIHLGVGDPDFDTPAAITDAAIESLRAGRTHYSPIAGEYDLCETIASLCSARSDTAIDTSQVCIFPGAQCALFAAMLLLTDPGDEVILFEPFYATYEGVGRAGGADVVTVPLDSERGFALNLPRIAAAINQRTRVILANSPGNPTGSVYSRSEWKQLVELCIENDIWLISDEVYSDYVYDGTPFSALMLPEARNHTVVVSSISKSHAMTGWRLGWSIAPPSLATELTNLAQFLLFGVSQFTQDAVNFALRERESDARAFCAAFRERRDILCDALATIPNLKVHKPAGGMFAMVDVSALDMNGDQFANQLLDHAGVAVVPGVAFGDSAIDFVRIGFLLAPSQLLQATKRIAGFVENHCG